MKTGVTYKTKEFKRDGNCTTCEITAEINLNNVIRNFSVLRENPIIYKFLKSHSIYDCTYKIKAIGETHCRHDDVFNEDTGRKIADTKAQANIFLQASHFFEDLSIKVQEVFLDDIGQCSDNTFESFNMCYWHAKELGDAVDYINEL